MAGLVAAGSGREKRALRSGHTDIQAEKLSAL